MNDELYSQIYSSFNHKSTDELVELWTTNDRVEWSETAFEVMKDILEQRLGEAPAQNEPIFEHVKPEKKKKYYFEDNPVEIIADIPEAPLFYKPKDILWITYWLERAAKYSVLILILTNIGYLAIYNQDVILRFDLEPEYRFLGRLVSLPIWALMVALQCAIYYLPLRALGYILKVLMAMEFKSREVQEETLKGVRDY